MSKVKILIADDDRVVLFTLAEGLREADFDVIEARDGLQALDLCRRETPALALLDIRMPGLDGLELARRLVRTALARSRDFSGLQDAPASNRTIATAVGMLMHAEGLDQPAAFEKLRQQARGQRRKLEDVAMAMIGSKNPSKPS